jgi:hypothetical protein
MSEQYPHRDWDAFVESLDRVKYPEMYRTYKFKPKPVFEVIPIKNRKGKK